jgi:hypothetical protein
MRGLGGMMRRVLGVMSQTSLRGVDEKYEKLHK